MTSDLPVVQAGNQAMFDMLHVHHKDLHVVLALTAGQHCVKQMVHLLKKSNLQGTHYFSTQERHFTKVKAVKVHRHDLRHKID